MRTVSLRFETTVRIERKKQFCNKIIKIVQNENLRYMKLCAKCIYDDVELKHD